MSIQLKKVVQTFCEGLEEERFWNAMPVMRKCEFPVMLNQCGNSSYETQQASAVGQIAFQPGAVFHPSRVQEPAAYGKWSWRKDPS